MKCYRCDTYGEVGCEFAKFNPMVNEAECTHACVLLAEKARIELEFQLREANQKLRQYREAVKPIIKNCREIVAIAEKESKEGK